MGLVSPVASGMESLARSWHHHQRRGNRCLLVLVSKLESAYLDFMLTWTGGGGNDVMM